MSTLLASGGGVLFVLLAPFWVFGGGYFAGYAAHSFLTVLEQTASGADRVLWPREQWRDWGWKLLYLGGFLFCWTVPICVLLTWADWLPSQYLLVDYGLVTLGVIWLILPVSLLSALSSESHIAPLRWVILRRLALCWQPLMVYYALSGLLIFGWTALALLAAAVGPDLVDLAAQASGPGMDDLLDVGYTITTAGFFGLTGAAGLLLLGRLVGRLGLLVRLEEPPAAEEETDAPQLDAKTAAPEAPPEPLPETVVSATPAAEASEGAIYALANEALPKPPPEKPFRWEPGRMPPARPPRHRWRDQPGWEPPVDANERHSEEETVERRSAAALWGAKVLLFPWYSTSVNTWLWLATGGALAAILLRIQLSH